jgi:hypothetical protein
VVRARLQRGTFDAEAAGTELGDELAEETSQRARRRCWAPAEVQCRRNRGGGVVKAKLIFIAAVAAALALPFANIIWGDAPSP